MFRGVCREHLAWRLIVIGLSVPRRHHERSALCVGSFVVFCLGAAGCSGGDKAALNPRDDLLPPNASFLERIEENCSEDTLRVVNGQTNDPKFTIGRGGGFVYDLIHKSNQDPRIISTFCDTPDDEIQTTCPPGTSFVRITRHLGSGDREFLVDCYGETGSSTNVDVVSGETFTRWWTGGCNQPQAVAISAAGSSVPVPNGASVAVRLGSASGTVNWTCAGSPNTDQCPTLTKVVVVTRLPDSRGV